MYRKTCLISAAILFSTVADAAPVGERGLHPGLTGGYVGGTEKGYETPVGAIGRYSQRLEPEGGAFGLVAGYDRVLGGRFIAGLEVDAEYRDMDEASVQYLNGVPTSVPNNGYVDPTEFEAEWAFSVRPRAGMLFNEMRTLVYATGGLAIADVERSYGCVGDCGFAPGEPTKVTQDNWELGWTVGAGVEHDFGPVAARVEYRYTDYGDTNVNLSALYSPITRENQSFDESGVRAALLWRF